MDDDQNDIQPYIDAVVQFDAGRRECVGVYSLLYCLLAFETRFAIS